MAHRLARVAIVVAAAVLVGACTAAPSGTAAGRSPSSTPPGIAASGSVSAPPAGTASASSTPVPAASGGGGTAGKAPTQVCDLLANDAITKLTGGSVTRTDPFVDENFPQCVWDLADATKTGTAINTVLVAFAPAVIFDNNNTTGRLDVIGLGDAAYAYPPGQSVLKSSGAELWVRTHGLVMRIYTVPVDFEILKDAAKTEAWKAQSLAFNQALAAQVIAKL